MPHFHCCYQPFMSIRIRIHKNGNHRHSMSFIRVGLSFFFPLPSSPAFSVFHLFFIQDNMGQERILHNE